MNLSAEQTQELFQTLIANLPDAIVFLDADLKIRVWSSASETLLGISASEAIGNSIGDFLSLDELTLTDVDEPETAITIPFGEYSVDVFRTIFEFEGTAWSLLTIHKTGSRSEREIELERAATTDELSQLVNRRGFQRRLESSLELGMSLAIIDIDRFKSVNDQWGHAIGDQAIQFVAKRLNSHFVDPICVARLGGDEFAVILATTEEEAAFGLFDEFRMQLGSQVATEHEIQLSVSIGVAVSRNPNSARELLTTADQAMYRSKNTGRNRVTLTTL